MNLLIFECFSGGNYADQKLSSSILSEAYGMARTLVSDCKMAGHKVTTLMDSRLKALNPPNKANKIISVSSSQEFYLKLKEISDQFDAVYVIAPESGQRLEKLVEYIEDSEGSSLNCRSDVIRYVSNKMKVYETLKKLGLKTPETVLLDTDETIKNIRKLTKDLGYPMIFKPLDGVGCDGLSIVKDGNEIVKAVKKVIRESLSKQFIAQNWVKGKAASACVISNGNKALSITLNRQFVTLASPSEKSGYHGGTVPFEHKLEVKALKVAEKAVQAASGLKGYVGVDIILTDEEPVIIEINPRLTVSYVGLRKVMNFNPAETIIDAVTERKLPSNIQNKGYVFFSKVQVPVLPQIVSKAYRLKDVISPPFTIEENVDYALIAAFSKSLKGAQSSFYRTKKRLLELYSRGE